MTDREYLQELARAIPDCDSEGVKALGQELINIGIRLKKTGELK
jgi:hypothetical protein